MIPISRGANLYAVLKRRFPSCFTSALRVLVHPAQRPMESARTRVDLNGAALPGATIRSGI